VQTKKVMSSKDTEKNFVGQPIFKQLVDLLPKSKFDILALEHKTDRYYKAFPAWTQLVTMLFGVFSRCDSMGEICDGMLAMQGKLNYWYSPNICYGHYFGFDFNPHIYFPDSSI
jgi:hypothetical protein